MANYFIHSVNCRIGIIINNHTDRAITLKSNKIICSTFFHYIHIFGQTSNFSFMLKKVIPIPHRSMRVLKNCMTNISYMLSILLHLLYNLYKFTFTIKLCVSVSLTYAFWQNNIKIVTLACWILHETERKNDRSNNYKLITIKSFNT